MPRQVQDQGRKEGLNEAVIGMNGRNFDILMQHLYP